MSGALATSSVRLLPAVAEDDSPAPVSKANGMKADRAEILRRVMAGDPDLLDELRPRLAALKERCGAG